MSSFARGIVMGASTNATEVGVIALNAEKNVWEQWFLEDSGRAELPLSGSNETFPVGLAVDRTSQNPMIVGECHHFRISWSPDVRKDG